MTEKEKKDETERSPIATRMYAYAGIICSLLTVFAVCVHFGWAELRDDANMTETDMYYILMLVSGIINTILISQALRSDTGLHKGVTTAISVIELVFVIICIIALMDVSGKDIDLTRLALGLIAGAVMVIVWYYLLIYKGKSGKSGEERLNEQVKKNRIERYDKREVMESRSDMDLPNPGMAEYDWSHHRTYLDVRRNTRAFVSMMVMLAIVMTVGKHLDSGDGATACFVLAFIIGALMLRTFIYEPLQCAVLHGAMRYEEGVRYGLCMMCGYAVVCNILSCIVLEASVEIWDIVGYVVFLVGTFLMFILTFLFVVAGNRHNGHDFAFFDTDGYRKRLKDPREEEKE